MVLREMLVWNAEKEKEKLNRRGDFQQRIIYFQEEIERFLWRSSLFFFGWHSKVQGYINKSLVFIRQFQWLPMVSNIPLFFFVEIKRKSERFKWIIWIDALSNILSFKHNLDLCDVFPTERGKMCLNVENILLYILEARHWQRHLLLKSVIKTKTNTFSNPLYCQHKTL